DNRDIARRVEYGQISEAPLPSYQLDRGRLENYLSSELPHHGITLLDDSKVQQIVLQPQQEVHHIEVLHQGNKVGVQARWIVDASGRNTLLQRQLGLAKKWDHHANAVWFRIGHPIDIHQWSADPNWQGRIREGERRLSTNHLMGSGYWVWLIPLASGSTSIGIVA